MTDDWDYTRWCRGRYSRNTEEIVTVKTVDDAGCFQVQSSPFKIITKAIYLKAIFKSYI